MLQTLANINVDATYTCNGLDNIEFSGMLPNIVHIIVLIIKIVVPILLIIFGMMDLAKAVMAQKEDEIKKGQQTFVKRLIAAIIVFFIVTVVQIVIGFLAGDEDSITSCFDCFVNNNNCTAVGNNAGEGEF